MTDERQLDRPDSGRGLITAIAVSLAALGWAAVATVWARRVRRQADPVAPISGDSTARGSPAGDDDEGTGDDGGEAPSSDKESDSLLSPSFVWDAAKFLIPAGFLASIAYYFGWVRTRKLYRELGVDHALLGFSTDDYTLRSLGVLITPLPVVALYLLLMASLYVVARLWSYEFRRRDHPRVASAPTVVFAVVAAGASFWVWGPAWTDSDLAGSAAFLVISAGLAMLAADVSARQQFADEADASSRGARKSGGPGAFALLGFSFAVIFGFATFEVVRHYAEDVGVRQSVDAEAHPERFACLVMLSARPLELHSVGEPVVLNDIEYLRYGGLRVFTRSAGRLFVWPSHRSPRSGLVVVNESDVVSATLTPQRSSGPCPFELDV